MWVLNLLILYWVIAAMGSYLGWFSWLRLGRLNLVGSILFPIMLPAMLIFVGCLVIKEWFADQQTNIDDGKD